MKQFAWEVFAGLTLAAALLLGAIAWGQSRNVVVDTSAPVVTSLSARLPYDGGASVTWDYCARVPTDWPRVPTYSACFSVVHPVASDLPTLYNAVTADFRSKVQ